MLSDVHQLGLNNLGQKLTSKIFEEPGEKKEGKGGKSGRVENWRGKGEKGKGRKKEKRGEKRG